MSVLSIDAIFEEFRSDIEGCGCGSLFADCRPVWIYGAGGVGKDVYAVLARHGIEVHGFLDRNAKPGASWNGVPVRLPDDPELTIPMREQAHVVIGIFNREVKIPDVVMLLNDLRYGLVTTFLDLHDHFPSELGDRFWLTSRSYYKGMESPIRDADNLWSDEASRDLYAGILKFRLTKNHEALPEPDPVNQYFPPDLPSWPMPLRFVDCGAFNGDTLQQLALTNLAVEAIAAFEPDPANFTQLAESVRATASAQADSICLFPCGVGSSTAQVRFSSGQGEGSHVSSAGETVLPCVSLDDALPAFRPNLIKMDIEGAEEAALWGARHTIARHRPGLAVCVYHRPPHLWQIPLLIQQLTGGGGRFFLRSHLFNGFDLVCYWLPE